MFLPKFACNKIVGMQGQPQSARQVPSPLLCCTILGNAKEVHVIFAAFPCSLASDQFRKIIKTLHGTLCHMARSIQGTCLLARAQALGAMRKVFMPYGKKYSGHVPFGKGLGQCKSTSYLMPLCLLLFQANAFSSATDTVSYLSQEE